MNDNSSKKVSIHFIVSGRVQGVWFRQSTLEKARELGIAGWVRNLPSGDVEVLASAGEDQIGSLRSWLTRGPPLADVTKIEEKQTREVVSGEFRITY